MLERGHSSDGCDLTSTLGSYDLRKGDLFVMNLVRVKRVRGGEYLFRAANVCAVFCYCLLWLDA